MVIETFKGVEELPRKGVAVVEQAADESFVFERLERFLYCICGHSDCSSRPKHYIFISAVLRET